MMFTKSTYVVTVPGRFPTIQEDSVCKTLYYEQSEEYRVRSPTYPSNLPYPGKYVEIF